MQQTRCTKHTQESTICLRRVAGAVATEVPTTGYRLPPQEIIDLVDVPPEPNLSFSPDRRMVLQLYRPPPLPPISELARPELKLAGASLRVLASF